jgi:hypothetical protein
MHNAFLTSCFALTLTATAAATTYVVNATNAPGTDFTDLPPAIAAAVDGDVLIVKPGNYSGFTLTKALTIVGTAGVNVSPAVTISSVPAGKGAVLSRLALRQVSVTNCSAPVVFDQSTFLSTVSATSFYTPSMVNVASSLDVRFQRCNLRGTNGINNGGLQMAGGIALSVNASRVELAGCDLVGGSGGYLTNCLATAAGAGASALSCSQSSRVHVALTSVSGGWGGIASASCQPWDGAGGNGITIQSSSTVIVAGVPSNNITAGYGGPTGFDGRGCLVSSGTLRYSGATIDSIASGAGIVVHAFPDDPTLELIGDPGPGTALTFRLHGVAGHQARLQEGHQPLVINDGLAVIEKLTDRMRPYPLGTIPASGHVDYTTTLTIHAPAGRLRVMQGLELDPTFALLGRTNSVVTVVRD